MNVQQTAYATAVADPAIVYPCYKSFDKLIDVEHLKSLDAYVEQRIRAHMSKDQDDYFLNAHRLDPATPEQPGVREIWLSRTRRGVPNNYLDLDEPDLWELTEAADEFALLMDFIRALPFLATGRMLIIYDCSGNPVPAHRDHLNPELCHDFVWFRTNLRKPFYVLNPETGEKRHVESYSAWFDTVNQFHGTDRSDGLVQRSRRRHLHRSVSKANSPAARQQCRTAGIVGLQLAGRLRRATILTGRVKASRARAR